MPIYRRPNLLRGRDQHGVRTSTRGCDDLLSFLLGRLQDLKAAQQTLVDAHHSAGIVEFAAVVRGGEQGDELSLAKELVAILDDLMRAAYQIHVMLLQEAGDDVRAEGEGDAAVVFAPAGDVLVGIGPEEVAEQTAVRDLSIGSAAGRAANRTGESTHVCGTHHATDLLHGVEVRAQAAVHREDLLIDDRRDGQAVEAIRKSLPQLDVVPPLALVVEAVDTIDAGALVVAAEDEEVLRVLDLVGEQQADGLEGLLAAVDVVAEEQVVGFGREAAVLEEAEQVVVLPVNVTADLHVHQWVNPVKTLGRGQP